MKKILASVAAAALTVSAMSVAAFAADFTANLGAQFNPDFNATVGEWTDDAVAEGNIGEAVTVTYDFGSEKVMLAGNYLGIKTDIPWNTDEGAENPTVVVSSIKADGVDVAFDASKVFLGDNDSNHGHLKITLINEWGDIPGAPAVDFNAVNGDAGFSTLSITFTVSAPAGAPAPGEGEGEGEGENPPPPADGEGNNNTSAPGNTNTSTDPNKDKPAVDTGIEGVAVVAGLAIVAAGAVVVAKKRK